MAMVSKVRAAKARVSHPRSAKARGFTLIEVMVALAIVAVALPALLMNIGAMSRGTLHSRETAIAHWVAENQLQTIYLNEQMGQPVPKGRVANDVKMAGETWDYVVEIEDTEVPQILRLRVGVSRQGEDNILAEISGFMLAR